MNKTMYVVYWLFGNEAKYQKHTILTEALKQIEFLRLYAMDGHPVGFITVCAENPNQVGKMGADSIADGKTPDGIEYTWKKRRDG
jgi:hypothetical protein